MKKLSALFAAFAAVVALAACPAKDKDKAKEEPAMKTTETPAPTATTPDPAKPTDPAAQPAAQPADTTAKPADPAAKPADTTAKTDVPPECAEYRDVMAKVATCDKLGAQRDEFKKAFDASWAAIEKADAAGRATLATSCKTTAKAVKDALATACP